MPVTNGSNGTNGDAINKFEAAIGKFTPAPRGEACIVDICGELRTQIAQFRDTLDRLEELLTKSGDHVAKSSEELLSAIRMFSR